MFIRMQLGLKFLSGLATRGLLKPTQPIPGCATGEDQRKRSSSETDVVFTGNLGKDHKNTAKN